jgi:hypothetical protein
MVPAPMPAPDSLPTVDRAGQPCVPAPRALSGAASLASVSAFYGMPLEIRELARLVAPARLPELDEGTLLAVAHSMGFEAVPMEGGFENLPEVPVPMLVALRDATGRRYGVLYAVDDATATLADPTSAKVSAVDREAFCAMWTGEVVQIGVNEEGRRALASRLQESRSLVNRWARALGWGPPYWRRGVWLAATVAAIAFARAWPRGTSPFDRAVATSLAAACALSLWSWLLSDACVSCAQARGAAGSLPLAPMGTALYGALLVAPPSVLPGAAIGTVLSLALGAHLVLVGRLASDRLRCVACLLVAWSVAVATFASVRGAGTPLAEYVAPAVGAVGAAVMAASLRIARARQARAFESVARGLAGRVRVEPRPESPVWVIAFKKKGCSSCAFYDAVVRPGLSGEFGESVAFDERDLGDAKTAAPVLVVLGASDSVFVGLPEGEPYAQIQQAVLAALAPLGPAEGDRKLRVVGPAMRR